METKEISENINGDEKQVATLEDQSSNTQDDKIVEDTTLVPDEVEAVVEEEPAAEGSVQPVQPSVQSPSEDQDRPCSSSIVPEPGTSKQDEPETKEPTKVFASKLANNMKSVLSSMMKTSISEVIRSKMDKTPMKADLAEPTVPTTKRSSKPTKDMSDESSQSLEEGAAREKSLKQTARKSMNPSNPSSPDASVSSQKDKSSQKNRKRKHFKGGTYNLYLSSSKKKKNKLSPKKSGSDQTNKDDGSSVTETTGSFADSEEEEEAESYVSETYPPSDEVSLQEDSAAAGLEEGGRPRDYNVEVHPQAMKNDMQDAAYIPLEEEATIPESSTSEATLKAGADLKDEEEDDDDLADNEEEVPAAQKPFIKPQELDKNPAGAERSSIASSVKTRQRMKKRMIDDPPEGEAPNNNDSPHSSSTSHAPINKKARKSIPGHYSSKPSSPVGPDPIEFSPKVEYPDKLQNYPTCTCLNYPLELNVEDAEQDMYCQALDSLDDKLIGCCNTVSNRHLVRPAYKVPFFQMCDAHLWRLRHHHCCPGCGIFCTQGSFYKCSPDKEMKEHVHLFHRKCVSSSETHCLHCNSAENITSVRLELNMPSAPVFHLSQKPLRSTPKAKMMFTRTITAKPPETAPEDEAPSRSYKVPDTEKMFSSAGLPVGPDRTRLEQMIVSLANLPESIPDYVPQGDLYYPALNGNFETILQLLVAGCDPNQKYEDSNNETALHAAAKSGQQIVVHLLLQGGAVLDPLDAKLYTPFMLAVENRHLEVVRYLIKVGAHLDAKGEDGMTSLHLAAREGDVEICKLLLDTAKLNVNIQDDGGWTPIVWASEHRHIDVIRLLLSRGADPTIRDNEENTALHWSSYSGSLEISHILLDCGCDLSAVNVHGDTPLHIAARQDNNDVVVLFLDRGADGSILNSENKTALMCCPDASSDTWYSLKMNWELKRLTSKIVIRTERVMCTDISRGKELHPIQCVNGVDLEPPPTDYLYVTENCETSPMNIDRTITSLQFCRCQDDCTTPGCTCATISFKCWFDKDGILLPEFNMLDPPMIFECNRACLCWKSCNNRMIQHGVSCRLQLFRVEGKGWGVRALKDIPKGTFICEYVGEIITDSEADHRKDDSYLFDLDNRDGETYCLDARHYGNISRFINHLCEPNIIPVKVFVDHQDLGFPRIAFFSFRDIKAFEELGFDYGEKFWVIKYKSFTCCCGSAKCKYSRDTIQDTLANYNRRLREEQNEEEASTCIPLS